MSGTIRAFPGVPSPELPLAEQPRENVVELLERYLAEAKRGEIASLAVAVVRPGQFTVHGWVTNVGDSHNLFASIADLSNDYAQRRREVRELQSDNGGSAA